MSERRNRAQRREDLRRARRNKKENLERRATEDRRTARMGMKRDATDINRENAMRAVGVEVLEQSSKDSVAEINKSGLVVGMVLLAILGIYHGWVASTSHGRGITGNSAALISHGDSALSIF